MNQSEIPNPSDDDISELFSDAPLWNRTAPLAAGYVAGSCGIIVGHPLDSLKVLLQTGGQPVAAPSSVATAAVPTTSTPVGAVVPSVVNSTASRNISTATISPSTSALLKKSQRPKRSFLSLYAGVGGPLLSIGIVQSLNFGMYDGFRRALYYHFENDNEEQHCNNDDYRYYDSLWNVAISSTAAGGIISFVTSPLMVLKTKQQLMMWSMKKAARDTLRHKGGVKNFFSGFGAHFFCDSLGRGVYFTSYEYLKRQIIQRHNNNTTNNNNNDSQQSLSITLPERMSCAALSGMLCWTIIFPADVVRSKVIAHSALLPLDSAAARSSEMMRRLWNKDGFRPFFRGWGVTVARAGPVAAVVMPIYDLTLEWMTRGG